VSVFIASAAFADVVVLKDGSRREGRVLREDDQEIVLEIAQGRLKAEIVLARADITSIEKGPTANECLLADVESRRAALEPDDTAGWLAFAGWLDRQNGFSADARAAFEKVIALDRDNETARARLGYEKAGGQWLTRGEVAAAKGPSAAPVTPTAAAPAPTSVPAGPIRVEAATADRQRLDNIRIALADEIRQEQQHSAADTAARERAQWLEEMQALADRQAALLRAQAAMVESGGVVPGPYGYGYYGVHTTSGQYLPFVPHSGQTYYLTGTSLDCRPFVGTTSRTRYVTVPSTYIRYSDGPWTFQLGGGGTNVRYVKKK
jgi:hypothetical protein